MKPSLLFRKLHSFHRCLLGLHIYICIYICNTHKCAWWQETHILAQRLIYNPNNVRLRWTLIQVLMRIKRKFTKVCIKIFHAICGSRWCDLKLIQVLLYTKQFNYSQKWERVEIFYAAFGPRRYDLTLIQVLLYIKQFNYSRKWERVEIF